MNPYDAEPAEEVDEGPEALNAIQGANPFIELTPGQVAQALGRWGMACLKHPTLLASRAMTWGSEELKVLVGASEVEAEAKDRRFADDAWQQPGWRRLKQSYLLTRLAFLDAIDDLELDDKSAMRARFALTQITEAAAPTNNLLFNPRALRRVRSTRGMSLVDGALHMLHDLRHNGGMPSQVDTKPFRLGDTIAVTPGKVVYRTPMFEVIQYATSTDSVASLPTVIIPPQINRYYFLDMAPGRSLVEYSVSQGIQTFMVSWRNPGPKQRDWGLDEYAGAIIEAVEVAAQITRAEQVNVMGFCSGGMTLACVLSHLAHTNNGLVNAATLAVTLLDTRVSSLLNVFASERTVASAIAKSQRKGVLEGSSLNRVFAFMRPNDLVWNYWVSNYLMGEKPPAFDVLAWNADATNLPAALHAQFIRLWNDNCLMESGTLTVLGSPVVLGAVEVDVYAVGALTDHLVPWQSVYGATRVFGGEKRFVLSNSGHIQALINPPGNPKSSWQARDDYPADAEEWRKGATRTPGSWWEDWARWTLERSGEFRPAPKKLGSRKYPTIEEAPGRYVRE